jgi:inactivated superfamily I helicase
MSFDRSIETDLVWREAELASLKNQARRVSEGSTAHKTLLRALLAMLYAHYEGFCLYAIRLFLERLENERVASSSLRHEVMLFALEQHFRRMRKANPSGAEFIQFSSVQLPSLLADPVSFERDQDNEILLEGRSNLRPHHLEKHCEILALPPLTILQSQAERARLWQLVDRRNAIAHGRQLLVHSISEYQPYEDAAIVAMHELAVILIDSIEARSYMIGSTDKGVQLSLPFA